MKEPHSVSRRRNNKSEIPGVGAYNVS